MLTHDFPMSVNGQLRPLRLRWRTSGQDWMVPSTGSSLSDRKAPGAVRCLAAPNGGYAATADDQLHNVKTALQQ